MHACPLGDEAIAYSLRQLPPDEERAYLAHLDSCLACRLKLQEIADTLDLLPLAVPDAAPPPALKGKILRDVARDARASAMRTRRWAIPAGAVATVVALAVGTYSLLKIQTLQERLAVFEQVAPMERTVMLQGTAGAPSASGRVVVARDGSGGIRIALQAQGLPPLQPGEAYQLWLIKDGKRRSGGVFCIDGAGTGGVATWLPDQAEFDALGITKEPDPLGQQPRGPKVMGSV